jgi:hypothetical protein
VTIVCEGFNKKNHYDRETPCDQDFLRKMAKDTDAEALMRWLGQDVVRVFRHRRAFDKEGLFIKKYLLNTAQLCWADENRFAKR